MRRGPRMDRLALPCGLHRGAAFAHRGSPGRAVEPDIGHLAGARVGGFRPAGDAGPVGGLHRAG
eukprot:11191262-Lingulodinium_polyedra.AAC.1